MSKLDEKITLGDPTSYHTHKGKKHFYRMFQQDTAEHLKEVVSWYLAATPHDIIVWRMKPYVRAGLHVARLVAFIDEGSHG